MVSRTILIVVGLVLLVCILLGGAFWIGASTTGGLVGFRLPAAAPTLAPAVAPQPAVVPTQGTQPQSANQSLYGLPPQPQIGHPSMYLETGVPCQNQVAGLGCTGEDQHTKHWVVALQPGSMAIIGGFKVDGVGNGVYKAVGSGTVDTTVTDGFVAITKSEWANAEFCFRVGQARQFGWAMGTVAPLSGWTECK